MKSVKSSPKLQSIFLSIGMLPVLAILTVSFHMLSGGKFFTFTNIGVVLHQASVNAVIAAGMTFVILSGGIDLSISAIVAACTIAGLIVSNIAGLSYLWVFAPLLVGVGFGLFNGFLIGYLRLPSFIVTLGSLTIVLGIARATSNDMSIYNTNLPYAFIGNESVFGIPLLAIIALLVFVVSWFVLRRTVLGSRIYAVGCNDAAARLSGIDASNIRFIVYGISGLLAGVGAIMLSSKLLGANALQVGHAYAFNAIAAVLLGGTSFSGGIGSIWGTLIGVLIIVVLSNGLILIGIPEVWQSLSKGLIIILAVTLDKIRNNSMMHD